MTKPRHAFAARNRTVHRGHRWTASIKVPLSCALIAGASVGALLSSPAAPAGADAIAQQITSLQAQASQISSAMVLEQLQIGGYQQQYNEAMARVHQDQLQVAQSRLSVARLQRRILHDAAELRTAAVKAYETGGAGSHITSLFTGQSNDGSQTEYEQILEGTVSGVEDHLRSDRQALQVQEASLQGVEAQDQSSQADAATLLQQSQSTQQELQQQSSQVTGQLAVAVAQQQAQEAAAAAAAVAAAQAKAAAAQAAASQAAASQAAAQAAAEAAAQRSQLVTNQVTTAAAPAPAPAPSGGSTATPVLNSFLQCVVQAESSGNYQAVSPTGTYMGAFQFSQPTWNEAAQLAGQPQLVGVPPNQATPAEQDELAIALYSADGSAPWYDPCTGR